MNHQVKSVKMTVGETTKTFDSLNRGYLVETGYLKAGETVTLENKGQLGRTECRGISVQGRRPEGRIRKAQWQSVYSRCVG